MKVDKNLDTKLENKLTDFDPDLSPDHPTNIEAAEQRSLKYDKRRKVYVDSDGCPRRDKYGQTLG